MELRLTVEEREVLTSLLEEKHRELLKELFHTDTYEFKQLLRQREKTLEAILSKLGVADSLVA